VASCQRVGVDLFVEPRINGRTRSQRPAVAAIRKVGRQGETLFPGVQSGGVRTRPAGEVGPRRVGRIWSISAVGKNHRAHCPCQNMQVEPG
jgi:hypothetical protein